MSPVVGTMKLNLPSLDVVLPTSVPTTFTEAPGSGSPVVLSTLPLSLRCADAVAAAAITRRHAFASVRTIPSSGDWAAVLRGALIHNRRWMGLAGAMLQPASYSVNQHP